MRFFIRALRQETCAAAVRLIGQMRGWREREVPHWPSGWLATPLPQGWSVERGRRRARPAHGLSDLRSLGFGFGPRRRREDRGAAAGEGTAHEAGEQ